MSARAEILDRLGRVWRPSDLPQAWSSQRDFPDLVDQFCSALTAVHGETYRVPDQNAARRRLAEILRQLKAQNVVVNPDLALMESPFQPGPSSPHWRLADQQGDNLRAICDSADVGISGVDAALAETGSLIVSSGSRHSRLATLLPPVHIALVPQERIFVDIFAWVASRPANMPANLTLISGPSKTADIEQTMAVGVHGPKRLIAILYSELGSEASDVDPGAASGDGRSPG